MLLLRLCSNAVTFVKSAGRADSVAGVLEFYRLQHEARVCHWQAVGMINE